MFRQLREDARDFPATMTLGVLWVVVFASMVVTQLRLPNGVTSGQFVLGLRGGHRYGDMTLHELFGGEVWRSVTATFVHYGLLHIGMNIYALYHLGCLVESWYGPGQFVAIYVLTGGVGNILSGLFRRALHWDPMVPSGGGSVVVMGLVGLCAVVGWRARTRLGDYLRNQMVWVLVLTAAIGLILPLFGLPIIDNWGHACGAAVGAVIGLANKVMSSRLGKPSASLAGWLGGLILAASAFAQFADDRAETNDRRRQAEQARIRWAEDERRLIRLDQVRELYRTITGPWVIKRGTITPALPVPKPAAAKKPPESKKAPAGALPAPVQDPDLLLYLTVITGTVQAFESMAGFFDPTSSSADYARVRQLLRQSLNDPPTFDEVREYNDRVASLRLEVVRDLELNKAKALAYVLGGRVELKSAIPPRTKKIGRAHV